MAKRRRRQKTEKKGGWSAGQVVLAAAILLLLASLLRSAPGLRHGLLGSYVWATAFVLTFLIALERASRFLLPAEIANSHVEGYYLLLRYVTRVMLPPELRRILGIKSFPPAPVEVSQSFVQVGVGFVDSHYCLALVRGPNYSRAAGPGFVKLNPGEAIRHVIDLRPHIRSLPVKATTKDGIDVETNVTVVFRVRQNPNEWTDSSGEPDPRYAFPYARDAIFRISFASGILENETELPWTERIAPVAAANVVTELSRLTLDELYQPGDPNNMPLERLTGRVRETVLEQIQPIFSHNRPEDNPIQLLSISVEPPVPPFEVVVQRIQNWQSNWQRRIYLEKASGEAEATRRLKMARARVQLELIENIMHNIEMMRRDTDLELSDIVTLRVLETLEQTAQLQDVNMLIPNRVMSTMSQIKQILAHYEGDEDEKPPERLPAIPPSRSMMGRQP